MKHEIIGDCKISKKYSFLFGKGWVLGKGKPFSFNQEKSFPFPIKKSHLCKESAVGAVFDYFYFDNCLFCDIFGFNFYWQVIIAPAVQHAV